MDIIDLTYIKMGIQKEIGEDVRIHERMPQETLNLLINYVDCMLNPANYDSWDLEVYEAALKKAAVYWQQFDSSKKFL